MKKFLILMILLIPVFFNQNLTVYAFDGDIEKQYVVYTTDGNYLFEKSDVKVFDNYISKSFDMYEIVEVNDKTNRAIAKFIRKLDRPNVKISSNPSQISVANKNICLYLTHNDESFVPTDGVDSVYGAGGIHDVAKAFKRELELFGVNVVLDETLHIPHNSSAYSRSGVTAKNLYKKYSPNAMFDVHRDGVSRNYYLAKVNGEEAEIVKSFFGFMAVKCDEGVNEIVFEYQTPGLKYGAIISVFGLLVFVIYLLSVKKNNKSIFSFFNLDYSEPDYSVVDKDDKSDIVISIDENLNL